METDSRRSARAPTYSSKGERHLAATRRVTRDLPAVSVRVTVSHLQSAIEPPGSGLHNGESSIKGSEIIAVAARRAVVAASIRESQKQSGRPRRHHELLHAATAVARQAVPDKESSDSGPEKER